MSYCGIHQHTCFSFLDSLIKPEEMVEVCKELKYPGVVQTDHGHMGATIKLVKECKKADMKYVPGCEFYFADDGKEQERKSCHLTVIAQNNTGLENLFKLLTYANMPLGSHELAGFYYKPRINFKMLRAHHEGLIVLTGCMASIVNRAFIELGYESGKVYAEKFLDILGPDHFFVEIQYIGDKEDGTPYIPEQKIILEMSRRLAADLNIKSVATADSHWVKKYEDTFPHEILKTIEARGTLATPVADQDNGTRGRLVYRGIDYHLRSEEEMLERFTPDEVHNSGKIIDSCDVSIPLKQNHMPKFDDKMTDEAVFKKLREECFKGYKSLGLDQRENKQVYIDRMKVELKDIQEAGLQNYFMIVWDVIRFCRENKIPVGRGRGSAAGSLTSYLLRITDVDPIEYGLIWERFWNRGRKGSMPDVDLDIAIDRREEVVNYLRSKFGRDRVYPMITFSTMSVKAAIKDVGKALGLTFDYTNGLCKHVPHKCESIDDAIDDSKYMAAASLGTDDDVKKWESEVKKEKKNNPPDNKKIYELNNQIAERKRILIKTFEIAKRLENITRQRSSHACALLIADQDIFGKIPLVYDSANKKMLTGFDMYDLEEMGYLKLDILGLKTLSVLTKVHPDGAMAVKSFDDPEIFKLITNGDTKGVFQLESPLGKQWCKKLAPKTLLEVSDLISLIRPAVLEAGLADEYIKNKNNPDEVSYLHPQLEKIFKDTHGVMIYQEQQLELAKIFAGFSLEQADHLRKATGKKLPEEMAKYKDEYIKGCINNGYTQTLAEELWGWTEKGASYNFNKSHSVSYAMLAYTTAWMKKYYPEKFFCAMLQLASNEAEPLKEITELFYDAQMFGVKVLPPSVKTGNVDFQIATDQERALYYGLGHIKHIGKSAIESIKNLNVSSWEQIMLNRSKLKKDTLTSFILSGAFDYLGKPRRTMKLQLDFIDELTDKENELFKAILNQTKYVAGKKEVDFTGTITPDCADKFGAAVNLLCIFIENKNPELKIVSKGRDERLLKVCDYYLQNKPTEEYTIKQLAAFEIYYLGIPAQYSEVDVYQDARKTHFVMEIKKEREKAGIATIAIVNDITEKTDRNGNQMAFLSIFDRTYMVDCLLFSKSYEKYKTILQKGGVYYFEGVKQKGSLCINHVETL